MSNHTSRIRPDTINAPTWSQITNLANNCADMAMTRREHQARSTPGETDLQLYRVRQTAILRVLHQQAVRDNNILAAEIISIWIAANDARG